MEILDNINILFDSSITDEEQKSAADLYIRKWQLQSESFPQILSIISGEIGINPLAFGISFSTIKVTLQYRLEIIETNVKIPLMKATNDFIIANYGSSEIEQGIINLAINCFAGMFLLFYESPSFSEIISGFDLATQLPIVENIFAEMSELFKTGIFRRYGLIDFSTEKYEEAVGIMAQILSECGVDALWLTCISNAISAYDNFSVFGFAIDKIVAALEENFDAFPLEEFIKLVTNSGTLDPSNDEENAFIYSIMEITMNIATTIKDNSPDEEKIDNYMLLLMSAWEMRSPALAQESVFAFISTMIDEIVFVPLTNEYWPQFIERFSQFITFLANENEEFKAVSRQFFSFLISLVDNGFPFDYISKVFNTTWIISPETCMEAIDGVEPTNGLIAAISEIDPKVFPAELRNVACENIIAREINPTEENRAEMELIINFIEKIGIITPEYVPQFLQLLHVLMPYYSEKCSNILYEFALRYHKDIMENLNELAMSFFECLQFDLNAGLIPALMLFISDAPSEEMYSSIGEAVVAKVNECVESEDIDLLYNTLKYLYAILHRLYMNELSEEMHSFVFQLFENVFHLLERPIFEANDENVQTMFACFAYFGFTHNLLPKMNQDGAEDATNINGWFAFLCESEQFSLCHLALIQYTYKVLSPEVISMIMQYLEAFDITDSHASKEVAEIIKYFIKAEEAEFLFGVFGPILVRAANKSSYESQKVWVLVIIQACKLQAPPEFKTCIAEALQMQKDNGNLQPEILSKFDRLMTLFTQK